MSWRKSYINTVPINWNYKTCHSAKAHNFYRPFIADGECLCAFWADKSRDDFIQDAGGSLRVNLDNFIW